MTPEQLEEIPGIGEKTLERISVAVRHYFGQYEEGEVNPHAVAEASPAETEETQSLEVDEPGTPDEPTEEATAGMPAEPAADSEVTETMEAENDADPEREHPVDPDDVVPVRDVASAENAGDSGVNQTSEGGADAGHHHNLGTGNDEGGA